jgi:hypothetical protein
MWTEVIQGPVACICAHHKESLGNMDMKNFDHLHHECTSLQRIQKEFHTPYSVHCNSVITIQTNKCIQFY